MATGEGQLELAERVYPIDGDPQFRREALRRIIQWFPTDRETVFMANMRLLQTDMRADPSNLSLIDRATQLIGGARGNVPAEAIGWGEYVVAVRNERAGRKPAAVDILKRLAAQDDLSSYRRGWSAIKAADILKDDHPDQALDILNEKLVVDASALPSQYSMLADLMLRHGHAQEFARRLNGVLARSPQQAAKILSALISQADSAVTDSRQADAQTLLELVRKAVAADPSLSDLREQADHVSQRITGSAAYVEASASLARFVSSYHPSWWDAAAVDPPPRTREQYSNVIKNLDAQDKFDRSLRCTVEYLVRFPPEGADFSSRAWTIASLLLQKNRDPQLRDALLTALEKVPVSDRWYFEAQLTRGSAWVQENKEDQALQLLLSVARHPDADPALKLGAYRRRGEIFETGEKWDDALAMYKQLETNPAVNRSACLGLLHAVFINLIIDRQDEALRIVKILSHQSDQVIDATRAGEPIRLMIKLCRDPHDAKKYWDQQEDLVAPMGAA